LQRIGKFAATDLNNNIPDCGYRWFFDPLPVQFVPDITVIKLQNRLFVQLKADTGNDEPALPLLFEDALAIA